ncbi:hypothetical protein ACSBR2_017313 [Camellia fascicularis]
MDSVSSVFNGKLNILINNVGTNIRKPMVEFIAKEYATLFVTNFEFVFHMCQLAQPLLKASGARSVVFTSSVSGFVSLKSMLEQLINLQGIWHVSGQKTILGETLLHLGISKPLWWSKTSTFVLLLSYAVAKGVVMRVYGPEFAGALILSCAYTSFFFC